MARSSQQESANGISITDTERQKKVETNALIFNGAAKNKIEITCRVKKSAKKAHYGKKFELAKGNIKKTWELINELRGKSKRDIKASFLIDGRIVTERREIANGFNIYFSSIARNLNSKVQSSVPSRTIPDGDFNKTTFKQYC